MTHLGGGLAPPCVFIVLEIKNNIKFQCENARIRRGVRLERRVTASLVSQRHPLRLTDGLYPLHQEPGKTRVLPWSKPG